jgi:hypothetical protein
VKPASYTPPRECSTCTHVYVEIGPQAEDPCDQRPPHYYCIRNAAPVQPGHAGRGEWKVAAEVHPRGTCSEHKALG